MALISVIIPVYNRYAFLLRAVRSVFAQVVPTGHRVELIVVDDGSTDATATLQPDELMRLCTPVAERAASTYATSAEIQASSTQPTADGVPFHATVGSPPTLPAPFENLRVLHRAHSGFPGAVRNAGAAHAEGRWLAFLDSDDEWLPHKLTEQLALAAAEPTLRIIHTRERWVRNGVEVSQVRLKHRRGGDLFEDSLHKTIVGPSTVLLRRDLWDEHGGFRDDIEVAEDYELWLRITAAEPVGHIDKPCTVKHAGHGDQLSERYGRIEEFRIAALLPLVERGLFDAWSESRPWHARSAAAPALARRVLAEKCTRYAAGAAKRGRATEAAAYERRARHFFPQAW